jgi:hypothetical protein
MMRAPSDRGADLKSGSEMGLRKVDLARIYQLAELLLAG